MLKKLPSDKISGTKKCLLFFFCESYFSFASLTFLTFLVFQDVFKTYLQYVFLKRLQDVFKTYSRRVCKTSCNYVFKTSWKTKICYTEDVFKTSSRRLQYVLTKTNVCWEDALTLLSLL